VNALAPNRKSPPAGLSVSRGARPGAFTLRRRWARPKHVFFVAAVGGLAAYLAPRWIPISEGTAAPTPALVVGSIFALWFTVRVLSVLVSRTTVTVNTRSVHVQHGPFPSLVWRPASVSRDAVRDFEARPWMQRYEVVAVDAQGQRSPLVRPLITPEQADYVRDALREAWSLPEGEVLPQPDEATESPSRSKRGLGLAALPFVGIPLILVLFFYMTSSEVEGSASIGEGAQRAAFNPTDCRSGVPRGFFGVELTSDEAPGTVVRVVRDPTRGSMLAVERGGGAPQVFGPAECASLSLNVEQTSTKVNDVWVLRGFAHAQCEGLAMDVRFDGCH
jgi:hypothetical protein